MYILNFEMKKHLKPFKNAGQRMIHLDTLPFLTQYNLMPVLKQFTEEYPDIQLVIDEVEDEIVVLVSKSHPLVNRSYVDVKELVNEKFILMNKHVSIYQLCLDLLTRSELVPNMIRTARVESILGSVAANEGISMLCKRNFSVFSDSDVSVIPLSHPVKTTVVIAWRTDGKLVKGGNELIQFIHNNYEIESF